MHLKEWYKSIEKKKIEQKILEVIRNSTIKDIEDILSKQIFPSKRIRSYFLHALYEQISDKNDFYDISVAIELFHQATLIFDDVIDNTETRDGGRIALHNKLGNNISASGKADHIATMLMLLAEQQLEQTNNIDIIREFTKIRLEMFNAQLIDTFVIEKTLNTTNIEWLLNESYKKTSSFLGFPFFIYGIKFNKGRSEIESLKNIGKSIGILYQIGDDLFDIDNGIKSGTLSLTYPLAFLLDSPELLNSSETSFIEKILRIKILNYKDAKKLNSIYKKYIKNIKKSSKQYFKKYYDEISNSELINQDIKNKITKLLEMIIVPEYWEYKI